MDDLERLVALCPPPTEPVRPVRRYLGAASVVHPPSHGRLDHHGVRLEDVVVWGGTESADLLLRLPAGEPEEWPTLVESGQSSHTHPGVPRRQTTAIG